MSIELNSGEIKVNNDFATPKRLETAQFIASIFSLDDAGKNGVFSVAPDANLQVFNDVCEKVDFTVYAQQA